METDSKEQAIVAGGCFWCMEALFQRIKGVESVMSGYSGGHIQNPSYTEVKKGITGHYQVIRIQYDPKMISYQDLIYIFLNVHDPTQADGQGEDIGPQYKSAIFCNPNQIPIVEKVIQRVQQTLTQKIKTQIKQKTIFYIAEDYHQNYWNLKGKQNSYCDIIPGKIAKMKKLFKQQCVQDI